MSRIDREKPEGQIDVHCTTFLPLRFVFVASSESHAVERADYTAFAPLHPFLSRLLSYHITASEAQWASLGLL